MQDNIDDIYFFDTEDEQFVIRKVSEDANGKTFSQIVSNTPLY
jgi:hypothetical protein